MATKTVTKKEFEKSVERFLGFVKVQSAVNKIKAEKKRKDIYR